VRTVPFEPGQVLKTASTLPDADVLLVVGGFADELASAPVLLARSWKAAAFVGAGVEEVLAPLGDLREGLLGPAQWIPTVTFQPDEGPGAAWFVEKYRQIAAHNPPYPAAQAFAAGLLCARCLRESGSIEDRVQLATAQQLDCTTLYGRFRIDPVSGLQVGHQVLIVQWQEGIRRVVWPPGLAERPFVYPFLKK
jgi:branched-chain amino acid transport system substrate-binding protein